MFLRELNASGLVLAAVALAGAMPALAEGNVDNANMSVADQQAQRSKQVTPNSPAVADRPSTTAEGETVVPGAPVDRQPLVDTTIKGSPYLTGNWGCFRSRLADRGVKITANEIFDATYNVNGGSRQIWRGAGQFLFGTTIDTEKLLGITHGTFQLTIVDRHGRGLQTDAALGLLQGPQAVFGRGSVTRLSQIWYEQNFGKTQVKAGRFNHGDDFGVAPLFFENLALVGPASGQITGTYLYNIPVSAWGVRVRQEFSPTIHVNVAMLESNPVNLREDRGFYMGFKGRTGIILAGEIQWTPKFGAQGQLPGVYKVGMWRDSSDSADIASDLNGNTQAMTGLPFQQRHQHFGVHFNIEQQLTPKHDGRNGLSVGVIYARIDDETNRLHSKGSVRLTYGGLTEARPKDDLSFGVGRTQINDRLTRSQREQVEAGRLVEAQGDEYTAELSYGLHWTDFLTLRPGAQFIHHPGGYSSRHDIGILETRAIINF